ncbi:MAG: SUMF1/EgtB/PvdO family nonheme iron enzyme, partial [Eudoraea sp.]|nr:SUMF1/EgtB/PvdO family nonheme iron enzyme [Eudoraea sp.]
MIRKKYASFLLISALALVLGAFETVGETGDNKEFDAYEELIYGSRETIRMVAVPGGTFTMGSNNGPVSETPVHKVKVDDFWMSAYEITWDQYQLFADRQIDGIEDPKRAVEVDLKT